MKVGTSSWLIALEMLMYIISENIGKRSIICELISISTIAVLHHLGMAYLKK